MKCSVSSVYCEENKDMQDMVSGLKSVYLVKGQDSDHKYTTDHRRGKGKITYAYATGLETKEK